MTITALVIVFLAGFVIMTPIGPVSTICIRRSLMFGRRAGVVAGAGDAAAIAVYGTIGVSGSTYLPHAFASFTTLWHVAIAVLLVVIAIFIWRARPTLPTLSPTTGGTLLGGFGAALAIALANPADIILFAALFASLGVVVHTPLDRVLFAGAIFSGGCAYWIAMAYFLERWRVGLTTARMRWLNRTCSAFMFIGAAASLASLARPGG